MGQCGRDQSELVHCRIRGASAIRAFLWSASSSRSFGLEKRPTAHGNRSVKTKLAALKVIAVGWSRCAMQDVLELTRTGDVRFSVGVDFGEGQSGDESPHSKIYQLHIDISYSVDLAAQ